MDIQKVKQQTIADFIDMVLRGETDKMSPGDGAIVAIDLFSQNMQVEWDRLMSQTTILTDAS